MMRSSDLPLLAVQKEAIRLARPHAGFAYFMEQGLGKTLTAYADFLNQIEDRCATRLIVVCPNTFKQGWVEDAKKWALDFDFFIWEAGEHAALRKWAGKKFTKPPVLIVNWEAQRAKKVPHGKRHRWENGDLLNLLIECFILPGRVMGVFDESIKAKTHNSAQAIGAMRLGELCNITRVLSGKPVVTGPHDLWAQMRIAKQLKNREFYPFKAAFCRMGGWMNKQVLGAQNEDVLGELIDPYVFRATKADWTDLPPKTFTIREYKLTPELKAMYKSMEDEFVLDLVEDRVTVDAAITKYIKMAQIQAGWIFDEQGNYVPLVPDEKNPRLQSLLEFVEEELTGKLAVAYVHKPVFGQLLRNLGGDNTVAWIKGGMKPGEVEEQKHRFNNDPDVRHILLQIEAAKYGHTLLGLPNPRDLCATLAFYENTYSLDSRSQIEDRNHRHGQIADSVGYIDFAGTPLDRKVVRALQLRESIAQTVFSQFRRTGPGNLAAAS